MIRIGRNITGPVTERADVCIIGSGSGGAVAAAVLAEAGAEVVILEEGGYFTSRDFTGREAEMYPMLYRDGGSQFTTDGGVNVLQGRAIGGSTVINSADCTRIPPEVLEHWEKNYAVEGINEKSLENSYRRVEITLGVNRIRASQVNKNNTLLLDGAKRLGMKADLFRTNRTGCAGVGTCYIGCPVNAKKGAHLNFIPRAQAAGARIYADTRADKIVVRNGRATGVRGSVLDRVKGVATYPVEVTAKRIIVAAGAIHSPLLLARSGLGGGQVGRNLTLQPQIPLIAIFPERIIPWKGIPQSAYVDAFDHNTPEEGLGGYRMEGVAGGPIFGSTVLPGFGENHLELFRKFPNTASALILVPDRPGDGFVSAQKGGGAKIVYSVRERWRENARKGIAAGAQCYFEAGAEMVCWSDETVAPHRSFEKLERALRDAPLKTASARLVSAHCQGTCRMGEDTKRAVVDSRGSLHGVKGVTICDTSIFPSSASTHTMIPTMAMSDLITRRLIEAGI